MGNQPALQGQNKRLDSMMMPDIEPYMQVFYYNSANGNDPEGLERGNLAEGESNEPTRNQDPTFDVIDAKAAEARFSPDELELIKKEFDKLSKSQVIGRKKLLEYFGMLELDGTQLGMEIFSLMKNNNTGRNFINWEKFIVFVSIIAKGSTQEKLSVLINLFSRKGDLKITKEELRHVFFIIIQSMLHVTFEDQNIERLKLPLKKANDAVATMALNMAIDEIFSNFARNPSHLTYSEWQDWMVQLPGINEILEHKFTNTKAKDSLHFANTTREHGKTFYEQRKTPRPEPKEKQRVEFAPELLDSKIKQDFPEEVLEEDESLDDFRD